MGSRRVRFSVSIPLAAVIIGAACGDSSGPDYPALNHDPILFVHGLNGSPKDFDEMRTRFAADGWQVGVER